MLSMSSQALMRSHVKVVDVLLKKNALKRYMISSAAIILGSAFFFLPSSLLSLFSRSGFITVSFLMLTSNIEDAFRSSLSTFLLRSHSIPVVGRSNNSFMSCNVISISVSPNTNLAFLTSKYFSIISKSASCLWS
ncbi:hypothetical protein RchiOBHm_Chr1g0363551 [Rosa chinensis]|uniref:Uncharacterized protein n=1 Tax=Rosa chinensis TaxID=74649 RepID=A0A2P6SJH8_ROSCH|nr:hypothetical protein RchiOBHm_Chr1g0363551 [Rosa chinensis]